MYNCIKTELLSLREKTENKLTLFSEVEVDFLRRQVGRENSSIGQLVVVLSVIVVITYSLKANGRKHLFYDTMVKMIVYKQKSRGF